MFVVMSIMIIVTMMVMIKGILIKIIILTAIMVAERKKHYPQICFTRIFTNS